MVYALAYTMVYALVYVLVYVLFYALVHISSIFWYIFGLHFGLCIGPYFGPCIGLCFSISLQNPTSTVSLARIFSRFHSTNHVISQLTISRSTGITISYGGHNFFQFIWAISIVRCSTPAYWLKQLFTINRLIVENDYLTR